MSKVIIATSGVVFPVPSDESFFLFSEHHERNKTDPRQVLDELLFAFTSNDFKCDLMRAKSTRSGIESNTQKSSPGEGRR